MPDNPTPAASSGDFRAARLVQPGAPLQIQSMPVPTPERGSVRVRVIAVHVPPFTHAALSGAFPFPLPTPYTPGPGAVGVVEAVGVDALGLQVGDRVFCDPYLAGERPGGPTAPLVIGWFGLTAGASERQLVWRDGSFAERAVFPATSCTPMRALDHVAAGNLACLNYVNTAYGALLRGNAGVGQTIVALGATGNMGAAVVMVALALGVERVIAVGRNEQALKDVTTLDPAGVSPLALDPARLGADLAELLAATGPHPLRGVRGAVGADLIVDAVGLIESADHVAAAVECLRHRGTAVVIGGVNADISIGYQTLLSRELTLRGSFMGPPVGPSRLGALTRAGLLRLDLLRPAEFSLDDCNAAIAHAEHGRGLDFTVLTPNGAEG